MPSFFPARDATWPGGPIRKGSDIANDEEHELPTADEHFDFVAVLWPRNVLLDPILADVACFT